MPDRAWPMIAGPEESPEPKVGLTRWRSMIYFLASATLAMMGYIAWQIVFRLRPERIKHARRTTRGKFAFRPKERIRFLLHKAFDTSDDRPEWAEPLVSELARQPDRLSLDRQS